MNGNHAGLWLIFGSGIFAYLKNLLAGNLINKSKLSIRGFVLLTVDLSGDKVWKDRKKRAVPHQKRKKKERKGKHRLRKTKQKHEFELEANIQHENAFDLSLTDDHCSLMSGQWPCRDACTRTPLLALRMSQQFSIQNLSVTIEYWKWYFQNEREREREKHVIAYEYDKKREPSACSLMRI